MAKNPYDAYQEALLAAPTFKNLNRSDALQICPECGGPTANHLGASGLVTLCWACKGAGTMTNDQLAAYMTEHNRRVLAGEQ